MFGLSDKRVALLISQLPNAQRPCSTEQMPSTDQPLSLWLRANGLTQFQHLFMQHNIDVGLLPSLTDKHLLSMGVRNATDRADILNAINDMRKTPSSPRKRLHHMIQSPSLHTLSSQQQQQQQQHQSQQYVTSLQQLQQQQQQIQMQQHYVHQQQLPHYPHSLQLVSAIPMMQLQYVGDSSLNESLPAGLESAMTAQQLQQAMALQQQAMSAHLLAMQPPSSPSNLM